MKKKRLMRFVWGFAFPLAICLMATACSDDETGGGVPYDASKPRVLESFFPTEGALATKVILKGSNFGTDVDMIHVYFNEKEAPVISSTGDRMLVLAPKLPGEDCIVRVVVGEQEKTFEQHFAYEIRTNVTTVVGGDRSATSYPKGGENLAEVQFNCEMDRPIVIDSENNIYFILHIGEGNNPDAVYVINEESGKIRMLESEITTFLNQNYICYDQNTDRCYRFHGNIGSNELYFYDRYNDFAQTRGATITWTPSTMRPEYGGDWNQWSCKHQWIARPSDKYWYGRIDQGYFARVDPESGETIDISGIYDPREGGPGFAGKHGECNGMAFDPEDDTKLYFSMTELNAIMLYDFNTQQVSIYAGSSTGLSGWMDGRAREALFNSPRQICIDEDRNMYIADSENHCIRKIVMSTGYVSTFAGTPQVPGYANGTGDVAQFDTPVGLVMSKEGILYVGDRRNRAIRRIGIE